MQAVRWALAVMVLLAVGPAGHANVAVPIYKGDPGYQRARIASKVAPFAVVAAVLFAVARAARERSRAGKAVALAFAVLVLLWGGVMGLGSAGTSFPDEQAGQDRAPFTSFVRPRGSPRSLTPEETTVGGLLVFAGLCFGGLALVRVAARRGQGKGDSPGQGGEKGGP